MSPIIRILTDKQPGAEVQRDEVFISLEYTPLVLADVRRSLPALKEELRKKWPVEAVEIKNRISYLRKNPYDPSQVLLPACIGIVVTFGLAAAKAAGTKVGKDTGDEVGKHVRRWIRGLGKSKPRGKGPRPQWG